MTDLPSGWISGPLSDFVHPRGERVSPADFPELPFIGMDHVEPQTTRIVGSVPSREMKSSASRFYKNDVLYGRLRPYLNKVAQPSFDGLASGEFIVFEGGELIDPGFLRFRLHARDFVNFASHLNEGDRPRVNFAQIGSFEVLVPPPDEQHRIVEKIEALFDEIDQGAESLRDAQRAIALYRRSLLNAAFEGRLTADWRTENADKLESPEVLLACIGKRRQDRYETALRDWEHAVGNWRKEGGKAKKPAKPKIPMRFTSNHSNLQRVPVELPYGWAWSHLGCSSSGPEYGTSAKSSTEGDVPVVRMGNIQDGRIDWSDLVYTSNQEEIARYSLKAGDVLFNRTNSPDLVGKTAIYRGERPALFAGYLVRVNQINQIASGSYVAHFLNSPLALEHGQSVKTDGVNQSNINATKLQEYPFPLCSPAEQAEIVRILDARLESADALSREIDANFTRAEALRQSILKRAFSGKLVPQDPNDEPAQALLARIRSSRSVDSTTKPRRTTRRRAHAATSP